jgi:hypothetical protein
MQVLVKKNTAEYKAIKAAIAELDDKPLRLRSILLYALKPYHSLNEVVLLNDQALNRAVMYELAYESLREYFNNKSKKLFRDTEKDLYYFKSSAVSKWIESPFSFAGKLSKQIKKLIPAELKRVK